MTPQRALRDAGQLGVTSELPRVRMTAAQRREQLLGIGRSLFAERGYEATSIEEIALRARVSKPIVYEHFKSKEGLYAALVDREMQQLLQRITAALDASHPRILLEQAATTLLAYIEEEEEGFRLLVRDSPLASPSGTLASLIGEIASQVEEILATEFARRGFDPTLAPIYSRALIGMVALVGQWWLDDGKQDREQVATHLVDLAWNGLRNLEHKPRLRMNRRLDWSRKRRS